MHGQSYADTSYHQLIKIGGGGETITSITWPDPKKLLQTDRMRHISQARFAKELHLIAILTFKCRKTRTSILKIYSDLGNSEKQ